jgi:hypothetical protein
MVSFLAILQEKVAHCKHGHTVNIAHSVNKTHCKHDTL